MVRLPISGRSVVLGQPTGADDLLLLEAPAVDTSLALALLGRVARQADGAGDDWSALCPGDLETLLLRLRTQLFGDMLVAETTCPASRCGARFDVSFSLGEYLAHHRPRTPRDVLAGEMPPWLRLAGVPVLFRLPSSADQAAVAALPDPERELLQRCVQPADLSRRLRRRVEAAMEALAPCLSHDVQTVCPECDGPTAVYFDVIEFVLRELRCHATRLYEDIHLLARWYHWPEAEILALPRARRVHYAEQVRQERSLV